MKRSTKKALRIATAAVAGFGLLIGYLSYRNAQIARELDSEGVTTSAVVIGRHTEERTFHNRRRAPTQRQITRIEYEFTVDGKTYRNDVSGLSGSGALQRGDRVQIVYAPDDPQTHRFVRNPDGTIRRLARPKHPVRSVSDIRKTPRESACRRICRRKASPSGSRQPAPAARASAGKKESGTLQKPGPRTVRECATERRPYRARAASETLQLNA